MEVARGDDFDRPKRLFPFQSFSLLVVVVFLSIRPERFTDPQLFVGASASEGFANELDLRRPYPFIYSLALAATHRTSDQQCSPVVARHAPSNSKPNNSRSPIPDLSRLEAATTAHGVIAPMNDPHRYSDS